MGSLENLTQKIREEAEEESRSIRGKAEAEAGHILAQAREEAGARKAGVLKRGLARAGERKRRIVTLAQLEARKALLAVREELIEEVFRDALESLENLEDGVYRELLKKALAASSRTGDECVIFSPRDRARLGDGFIEEVNREIESIRGQGRGRLVLSEETRDICGGFILKGMNIEINGSFEALLAAARDELEPRVAEVLFGKVGA